MPIGDLSYMKPLADQQKLERICKAVGAIYYSAHWIPDRPVPNADQLWTELRNACGFAAGHSPKPL